MNRFCLYSPLLSIWEYFREYQLLRITKSGSPEGVSENKVRCTGYSFLVNDLYKQTEEYLIFRNSLFRNWETLFYYWSTLSSEARRLGLSFFVKISLVYHFLWKYPFLRKIESRYLDNLWETRLPWSNWDALLDKWLSL